MKDELKKIIPGHGLGPLKFGMTREEVRLILGEPDDIDGFSYSETETDLTESWTYEELSLSLSFDEEENWKLMMMSVTSDFYEIKEQKLIGLNREAVLSKLREMDMDSLNFEDLSTAEHPDHKLIEAESISMNFWLDNGILDEIQWSPDFIDDDTIDWPE